MDVVVFSQRLKRLLAGDEGILPDEVKEVLRRIQTDFELMTSFMKEHQHNLIGNVLRAYESNPQIWNIKKQLIDYSHKSDSAIDIFLLNIMQRKSQSNSRVSSDADDGVKISTSTNKLNLGEEEFPTPLMCADQLEDSSRVMGKEDESFPDVDEMMKRERGFHNADQTIKSPVDQFYNSSSSWSFTVNGRKMEPFHAFEGDHVYAIKLLRCLMLEGEEIASKLPEVNYSSPSSERRLNVQRRERKLINNKPRLVGREVETKNLLDLLIEGDDSLSAISIISELDGDGKTALAAEVYNSNYVKNYFDCRAWIEVSFNYNIHKILDEILKSVMPSSLLIDVIDKDCELKINALRDFLANRRFFIVLDDVWNSEFWKDFNQALPDDHNRSRVLITSKILEVGDHWNTYRLHIPLLSEEDSQEMLLDRVFIKEGCRLQLDPVINSLTKFCLGWPLAILCMSGFLSEMDIQEIFSRLAFHCDAAKKLELPFHFWIPSFSYLNLPLNLRPCFLYFAVFPDGFEILTWHLYQLWIAEGFIHDNSEATAEKYLKHLVDAGFVQVIKRTSGGRIKTCNIHGYLRHFLFAGVRKEKFIRVHLRNEDKPPAKRVKRLSIHFDASRFVPSNYSAPCLSSLLCLGSTSDNLAQIDCNYISENFKLLRVLDLGTLVLQQYPTGIQTLFLLRYLKLNIPFLTRIPSQLCNNLLNLNTLDMPNTSIDNTADDIWKMLKLRRLNFKLIKLPAHPGKYCNSLENLNFISNLQPSSCTQDILSRLPNLRSLRIYGNLSSYQSTLSESLCKPLSLESLKLVNKSENSMVSSIKLSEYQFPPQLTQLSLSNAELKDDPMPTLEKLPHLKILKLKHNSYIGRRLACTSGGFPKLEVLHLKSMLWLEEWTMETAAMPNLECLVIHPCAYLRKLPEELWHIKTFCKLELWWPRPQLKQRLKDFEDVERYGIQIYPSGI
ncbi:probable disease resistance protein RF9 [Mangifera indica]|uniref:probable disease resistance protein RF9 n=1 Tax=Mangifera indica TaxID=29780 RepID=UPI001CFB3176|nr:probable disease resistance protein RF9 [Mangifera indica]